MKYKVATPVEFPKSRNKKTAWVQIGNAWSDKVDGRITVALLTLPFRSEYIYLFPVDEEGEREFDYDFAKEID